MTESLGQNQGGGLKRRHRIFFIVLIIVGIFMIFPIIWLSYLTADFYFKIKSGEIESADVLKEKRTLSRIAANANPTKEDLDRLETFSGMRPEIGDKKGRLTVVLFVDYQCPYTKQAMPVVRKVMESYADQVRVIIRDFPIAEMHPQARDASHAALCALEQGQKAYWRYHELLLSNQENLNAEAFREFAGYANINVARFDECMNDRRYDVQIDGDINAGRSAGADATPTFFINGAMIAGALNERMLREAFDAFLDELPK